MNETELGDRADENEDLRPLHQLYSQYLEDLGRDNGRDHPVREYRDFVDWWHRLSGRVRSKFEADYRKGYYTTIAESRRRIAELVFSDSVGESG